VLLLAVLYGYCSHGPRSYRAEFRRRSQLFVAEPVTAAVVTEADLGGLPEPVAAYVRQSGAIGQAHVINLDPRTSGRIRSGPAARWMTFRGEQVNTFGADPARVFFIDATMLGFRVDVVHVFVGPSATKRVKAGSLVRIVNAALVDAAIEWQAMDSHHVRGTFTRGTHTATAVLFFNEANELIDFMSDDRLRTDRGSVPFAVALTCSVPGTRRRRRGSVAGRNSAVSGSHMGGRIRRGGGHHAASPRASISRKRARSAGRGLRNHNRPVGWMPDDVAHHADYHPVYVDLNGLGAYDPVWQAAVDLDLSLCFHTLTSKDYEVAATFRPPRGHRANGLMNIIRGVQDILGVFVFGGVFERFAQLKLLVAEGDAGWVPHWYYRADHVAERMAVGLDQLSKTPSEYVGEHVRFTFQDDKTAYRDPEIVDSGCLMWASDVPHTDSTYPHSQQTISSQTAHLTDAQRTKITRGNVVDTFNLAV
jgi:predicted TIM-barrel fold metal-dependent hydrolase